MDNYLIYLVQSYNREALKILVDKYRNFLQSWIYELIRSRKYGKDVDIKSLCDDLEIVIYRTIETYDSSKGVFYSYLKGAVHNMIMNNLRYNHRSIAYAISLEQEIDEDIILQDSIAAHDNISLIEERYYAIEELETLIRKIKKLKKDDQIVLYLKMQGYSSKEIAQMTEAKIRNINYLTAKIKKL